MDELSALTPTQQEAHDVLVHLLDQLNDPQSRFHARYGRWIDRHPKLVDFCFRCVHPDVWLSLEQRWNFDSIKSMTGALSYNTRGIYLSALITPDSTLRLYIGQSTNLKWRISQHCNFRYRRDHPSLHYHAFQKSRINSFALLCTIPASSLGNHTLPGMDCPDLLLNLLEMWMCLCFRSLVGGIWEEWLPVGAKADVGGVKGLNVRCPLEQGEEEREWVDLSGSEDELVREYVESWRQMNAKENMPMEKRRNEVDVAPVFAVNTVGALSAVTIVGAAATIGFMLGRARMR